MTSSRLIAVGRAAWVVLLAIDYRVSDFGRTKNSRWLFASPRRRPRRSPARCSPGYWSVTGSRSGRRNEFGASQGFLQRPAGLLRQELRAVLYRARGRGRFLLDRTTIRHRTLIRDPDGDLLGSQPRFRCCHLRLGALHHEAQRRRRGHPGRRQRRASTWAQADP